MLNSAIPFIMTFITTLIAAFIGASLAFRNYKREKLWQEKYDSYQAIFCSLYDMKHWASETYSSSHCLPTIGGLNQKQLHQGYKEARICISRYISIGKLIICPNIAEKLDKLNQSLWNEDFNFWDQGYDDSNYLDILSEHASKVEAMIDDSLEELIELAKKDLRYGSGL